jgi:RND family efflux transporter MFP subunit
MWLKHLWRAGWKLAVVAAVVGGIAYRLYWAPLPVEAQAVKSGPIVTEVMGTGTFEARVGASVSPKISGRIQQMLVDQGDAIKQGQLLAVLDDGDLRQQVQIAEATLAAIRAGVERSAAEIARALATAKLYRIEHDRLVDLRKSNAATPYELDKAIEQHEAAEAELRRSELAKIEIERQVVAAEATRRFYQERLTDTLIASPFDGLVIRRSCEAGDVVVPGGEIFQVICTQQMWVSAWVDETAMAALAVDQPARVVFRSEPERSYEGRVVRLAPLTDRETREFLVDVAVNPLPQTWAVGQRAEVYITTAQKQDALLVSAKAIIWRGGQPGVFVADAGHARWRHVELGLRGVDQIEVVEGLDIGQTVIWLRDPKAGPLTEGRAVSAR